MSYNLFVVKDPQGKTVRLTESCYYLHILVEHPDLYDPEEIEKAIRLPDCIAADAVDTKRFIYYRTYQRSPQRYMIKVVVEVDKVVTAYRVRRIKWGELILWQR
jgi:hypothetical protein